MTQNAATTAITGANLTVGTVAQQTSATVPNGDVISQGPASGTSVAQGLSVNLVVSSGPQIVTVPNVAGLTQAAATTVITGAKLVVATITQQTSGTVPNGDVISQNPTGGSSVAQDSPVNLIISSGPQMVIVPSVAGQTQAVASVVLGAAGLTVGAITQQFSGAPTGDVISQTPAAGTSVARGASVSLVLSQGLPSEPSTVAPPVTSGVTTTIGTSTAFLYSATNPIQTGVAHNTIVATRAAVLRGRVLDKTNAPLPGATISVLNHPEFGRTLSRADGMFDLAVNGGGFLTLDYQKAGLLSAQRQLNVPWQNFAWAPDVVLIPQDAQVTAIDLTSSVPIQVARGSVMTDSDDARQATIFIPRGTQATLVMPDGSTRPLSFMSVRATEFTVGPNGPQAMPAELPPTSGYTYAVELSADEVLAAGASEVQFAQPIPVYVENFLNFPVGTGVPSGFYDRGKGLWIASDNGRVIKVISVTAGLANLDLEGNGTVNGATALAALGITDAERQRLAALYMPGQELWRVLIPHFSPWDYNWPHGPPPDAEGPKPDPKPKDKPRKRPCKKSSSIIVCQTQTLGEVINLTGTPFSLHYQSDRVPGRHSMNILEIGLSGATLPPSLQRIHLEIRIAGRVFTESFAPAPNLTHTFTWDGKDAYGRTLQGLQVVTGRVGYEYMAQYYATKDTFEASFNRFGHPPMGGAAGGGGGGGGGGVVFSRPEVRPTTPPIILWQYFEETLGVVDIRSQGLGGWSLTVHHVYDPSGKKLYLGDGSQRSAGESLPLTITTSAGSSNDPGFSGDGGPATAATLASPSDVALGPDGSVYIADTDNHRIRRVGPEGIITTVAGGVAPLIVWATAAQPRQQGCFFPPVSHSARMAACTSRIETFRGSGG
jgi:beta-lactam-binding protein with PASTA domain